MNRRRKGAGQLLKNLLETRLSARMFFLYIIGGALPMILIGIYLIFGTNQILIRQAERAELTELELLGSETSEMLSSINMASKNFYFDEKLEEIAGKQYQEYQEIVKDYMDYKEFANFGNFYSRIVSWISIYMRNDTISENAHFVKADEEVEKENWYQSVLSRDGGAVWQYMPLPLALDHRDTLTLTRLLKTQRGEEIGVLVLYLRLERLQEQVNSRDTHTRMLLNDTWEIASNGQGPKFGQVKLHLDEMEEEGVSQKNVRIDGTEYVMTTYQIPLGESSDYLKLLSLKSYKDILEHANHQNRWSVLIFLFSAVFSVVMILLFSRSFSNRVARFHHQMQKAAAGNFDLEPSLGGNDEISELYGYLGTMIGDIQHLLAEIYQERLHAEQLKTQQREAEFKVLASQINPHFLYNTLETIRMKARLNHQPEIEELVKMLAKILRKNIRAGSKEVSIQEEIQLVECYLRIQQYRFGERIQYEIFVEEGLKEYRILPLIFQPLVENSIIHGLETKEGTGHIRIRVEREEDVILSYIQDDGLGISSERLALLNQEMNRRNLNRPHIGICNVHQRIQLKYGNDYGLSITSIEGEMTQILIRIPATEPGCV